MAGAVIVRRDFPALMASGLGMIFDENIKDMKEEFTDLFHMETSNKAYETELGFVGMGSPGLTAELEMPRYDAPKQGRPVTYINSKYSLGVAVSYEAREDDRYGKIANSIVPELATSFKVERNQQAADILNDAFDYQGYEPDGKSLVASDHPVIRTAGGASTQSNLLSLPLSVAGLQAARARLRKNRTESNKIQPLIGKYLIVGPSSESLAEELTQSTLKPGQSGGHQPNDVNVRWIRNLTVVVMNYLRDDGTYFVATEKEYHRLKWFDRKKLYRKTITDDEQEAVKIIGFARWARGFSDWRGIVGYEGA